MRFGSRGVARPLPCRGSAVFPQVKTSGYFLVICQRPANLQTCPKFAARFVMRRCGVRGAFARCRESDAFARCKERGALARCREGDAFGGRGGVPRVCRACGASAMRGIVDTCSGNTKHPPNCSVPVYMRAAYTRSLGFEADAKRFETALKQHAERLPRPALSGMWRQLAKTACGAAAAARRNKEDA